MGRCPAAAPRQAPPAHGARRPEWPCRCRRWPPPPGRAVRRQIAGPPGSNRAQCPSTWKVNTGAPATRSASKPARACANAAGAAGRKPANRGCSSGKEARWLAGAAYAGIRRRSAKATAACQLPPASTSSPTTKAGLVARARTSAASARAASRGRIAACIGRRAAGAASASQSSTGTETKVGQKGGVRATAKAWTMAAGTSAARAGSDVHLTQGWGRSVGRSANR